jgi:hypothetical protein
MSGATAARDVVVPGWLSEVVRPRRAPVPRPEMTRAALAICSARWPTRAART